LIAVCVFFAAIAVLFTARYPRGLYDFVMGMNRWALRVAACAALISDTYPPFRLDQGGAEPTEPETPESIRAPGRAETSGVLPPAA
jgi:hypothetical protein